MSNGVSMMKIVVKLVLEVVDFQRLSRFVKVSRGGFNRGFGWTLGAGFSKM